MKLPTNSLEDRDIPAEYLCKRMKQFLWSLLWKYGAVRVQTAEAGHFSVRNDVYPTTRNKSESFLSIRRKSVNSREQDSQKLFSSCVYNSWKGVLTTPHKQGVKARESGFKRQAKDNRPKGLCIFSWEPLRTWTKMHTCDFKLLTYKL